MPYGISLIIPAYNEAENLKSLLPKVFCALSSLKLSFEVLVIDTMQAMDDTESVCRDSGAICIRREGGNMYGDAVRTGIKAASYSYIVMMDADGSHSPAYITDMRQAMQKTHCDVVIGSRYTKGGNSANSFLLKAMSYILNLTYRIVFGIKARDVSNSFRLYKADALKSISLECENFDIVEEILIKLCRSRHNFSIAEVPIYFDRRKAGKSKRSLFKFILSYISTMRRLRHI